MLNDSEPHHLIAELGDIADGFGFDANDALMTPSPQSSCSGDAA